MDARLVVAGAVFVLTYALISVRRVRGVNIRMPYATAIGAVLMILLGIVSPGEAAGAVDTGTILLLLGMMLLTASLETSGLSEEAALEGSDALLSEAGEASLLSPPPLPQAERVRTRTKKRAAIIVRQ